MARKSQYTVEQIQALHSELGDKVLSDFAKEKGLNSSTLAYYFKKSGLAFKVGKRGRPKAQVEIAV